MVYNMASQKIAALRNHLKIPFYNNAYSLIGNQATSSILGMIFLVVVTRFYSSNQVGLGTGIYSAALLLTSLAAIGLGDGLTYDLPRVAYPDRLINAYFSLSSIVVITFAGAFILGQRWFSPGLEIIRQSPLSIMLFLSSTIVIHLSMQQDALFVADRVSIYSLSKNILANLIRLPIFALLYTTNEWSLILSAAISLLVGSLTIGKRYHLNERPIHRYQIELDPQIWKPTLGFSFGNYLMNIVVSLPNTLLPLFVLNIMGPTKSGYFYIAWIIPSLLAVIGRSFGSSVFVESGREFNSIKINTLRSMVISSCVLFPSVTLLVVLSNYVLLIFGKQYSLEGAALVRLLLVSCIPLTYYGILVGVLKAQGKIKLLLFLAFIFTGLHIVGALFFIPISGLVGIGWAVIYARFISFVVAVLFVWRELTILDKRILGNKISALYARIINLSHE